MAGVRLPFRVRVPSEASESLVDPDLTGTIRIKRKPKVITDDVGGTVWVDDVESVELELVSTMMLEVLIDEDEETVRQRLKDIEATGSGVLARDPRNASFEVVDDKELAKALKTADEGPSVSEIDELSLVSTQMLRVMIEKPELSPQEVSDELQLLEDVKASGGYDPYNSA